MTGQRILGLIPSLLIAALTIIYMVTGYRTLDEESRVVPVMTAWLTLFVILLDLAAGWFGKSGTAPARVDAGVTLTDEVRALLSLLLLVVAIYFLGFYVGGILYLLVSLRWTGRQAWRFSITTTIIAFVCIYLVFEKGLAFQLFRGTLFSE